MVRAVEQQVRAMTHSAKAGSELVSDPGQRDRHSILIQRHPH